MGDSALTSASPENEILGLNRSKSAEADWLFVSPLQWTLDDLAGEFIPRRYAG